MNVISLGEHLERDVPGSHASFVDETDDLRLPILKCAEVTMEELFKISYGFSMSSIDKRRRKRSQSRQTYQIFRELRETP